jgi:hypothetical protein
MIVPLFMMKFAGNVDVKFKDFGELVQHPLAAPL